MSSKSVLLNNDTHTPDLLLVLSIILINLSIKSFEICVILLLNEVHLFCEMDFVHYKDVMSAEFSDNIFLYSIPDQLNLIQGKLLITLRF